MTRRLDWDQSTPTTWQRRWPPWSRRPAPRRPSPFAGNFRGDQRIGYLYRYGCAQHPVDTAYRHGYLFVDGVAQTPWPFPGCALHGHVPDSSSGSSGTHSVSATFVSGNTTYIGSTSSSVTITVVAQGTAVTTTTVTITPNSFPLGNSVTLAATVTGLTAGTLTGPMTFTTGGKTIGTVQQVSIGPGNTATATLTVNALRH